MPPGITTGELRFAQLKLAAFSALTGWGRRKSGEAIKISAVAEIQMHEPFDMQEQMRLADALVTWALTAAE